MSGFRAVMAALWPEAVGVCDLWPIPMTTGAVGKIVEDLLGNRNTVVFSRKSFFIIRGAK
jgi:hypothetical protein